MRPMDHLHEQLWAPALVGGNARVTVNPARDPAWVDAESYWAIPDAAHARLLVPAGPPRVTAAALSNYRGLRFPVQNAARAAAGTAARLGAPLSRDRVVVQVHRDAADVLQALPLAMLSRSLGTPVHASLGVRTGDNRKATLSLVDDRGRPVGHAKFGWDAATDDAVAAETRVLCALHGRVGKVRAPEVLAALDHHGHPVVVTSPMPLDVRGAMNRVAPLTPREMYSFAPIRCERRIVETAQSLRVADRLASASTDPLVAPVAKRAEPLLARVARLPGTVPVASRWHGDLTPWNRARDSRGRLWIWDWESSEDDAPAGLDAVHWAFSIRRLSGDHLAAGALAASLTDAAAHLTAAGVRRDAWATVAAAYALTVVARACTLAAHHQSWASVWISPPALQGLLRQAEDLLDGSTRRPSAHQSRAPYQSSRRPRNFSSSRLCGA